MIEKVAESVEDLRLGQVQGVSNLHDCLTAKIERGDMAHRNTEPIDDGFAAAHAILPDNMRMFGLQSRRHGFPLAASRRARASLCRILASLKSPKRAERWRWSSLWRRQQEDASLR